MGNKEIRIKIDGSASGNNRTVIPSDLQILGRVYNTETGEYETDWAPLPARELDMHIEPLSPIEASVVLRVNEIENLRLTIPETNITAAEDPELDLEIGGPAPRPRLPRGVYNVYIGSQQSFWNFLCDSPGQVRSEWTRADSRQDVDGLRGISRIVSAEEADYDLLQYVSTLRERLARREGITNVAEWTR